MHDTVEQIGTDDGIFARWRVTPIIVQLYFAFALVATVLMLSIVYSKELHEWLLQWTGWAGLFPYSLGVVLVGRRILTGEKGYLRRLPHLMAVFATLGLFDLFTHIGEIDQFTHTNPYLRVHPWRPLVTVALPAAWALLIYLPASSRKWILDADSEAR